MNKNVKYVHNQLSLAVTPRQGPRSRARKTPPAGRDTRQDHSRQQPGAATRLRHPALDAAGTVEPQHPCTSARGEAPAGHKAGLSLATRRKCTGKPARARANDAFHHEDHADMRWGDGRACCVERDRETLDGARADKPAAM